MELTENTRALSENFMLKKLKKQDNHDFFSRFRYPTFTKEINQSGLQIVVDCNFTTAS